MQLTRDKPTETVLWRRIRHFFNHGHDKAYRIETSTVSGFPDVIWFPHERPAVLIELKAGPLRISRWQKKMFADMAMAGHPVWVIWQKEKNFAPVVYAVMDIIDWHDTTRGYDVLEWIERKREPQ